MIPIPGFEEYEKKAEDDINEAFVCGDENEVELRYQLLVAFFALFYWMESEVDQNNEMETLAENEIAAEDEDVGFLVTSAARDEEIRRLLHQTHGLFRMDDPDDSSDSEDESGDVSNFTGGSAGSSSQSM